MSTHPWIPIVGRLCTPADFISYVRTIKLDGWRPEFIVLHNTGAPRVDQWATPGGRARMKNLEHYYRVEKRWSAGPHLFIAPEGIWVFTPLTHPGVHSFDWNPVSWGVEMVGDYSVEPFDIGLGAIVRDNTVSALATLHKKAGLDSHSLRFHRENTQTDHKDCPGKHVDKTDMIRRVHDELLRRGDPH